MDSILSITSISNQALRPSVASSKYFPNPSPFSFISRPPTTSFVSGLLNHFSLQIDLSASSFVSPHSILLHSTTGANFLKHESITVSSSLSLTHTHSQCFPFPPNAIGVHSQPLKIYSLAISSIAPLWNSWSCHTVSPICPEWRCSLLQAPSQRLSLLWRHSSSLASGLRCPSSPPPWLLCISQP